MTTSTHIQRPTISYMLCIKSDILERSNRFVGPFESFEDAQVGRRKIEADTVWDLGRSRAQVSIIHVEHPTDTH